jgi:methyl-accepting chemotaxis protein
MPAVAEVQFKATNSQQVVTAFNSVGTAAGQAGTKIQQFTAGATTKIQQFTSSLNSIKSQGDPFSNLTTNLNSFNKSVDQSSKTATTFGQKLKNFGSQFGSSIATIGTLGGTILNLSRQYQDLGDSQIAVDRAQLKVSKTTEAVGVAQGKLNVLTAKGITTGAEYEQAQLDVKQALEAQSLAQQMLTEKQEDHQRAQENFWIGLVPTVTSAGASVISVINDIGGTKGIGGLVTKLGGLKNTLKTAFSGLTGAGNIASGISGIGAAASGSVAGLNSMTTATTSLSTAMKSLALSVVPVVVGIAGAMVTMKTFGLLIHEISSLIKGDTLEAVKSVQGMLDLMGGTTGNPLIDLFNKLSPASGIGEAIANLSGMKEEAKKLVDQLEKAPAPIQKTTSGLEGLDSAVNSTNSMVEQLVGGIGSMVNGANSVPAPVNAASTAISSVGTAAAGAGPAVADLSGTFATITSNVGPATTGIAGMNAQMNPFNANLVKTKTTLTNQVDPALQSFSQWMNEVVLGTIDATRRNKELATVLAQATQHFNKAASAASKYNSSLGVGHYSNTGGTQPGTVVNLTGKGGNPRYVTFRGGKQIASGYGTAPPYRKAASGMHETVTQPTWILAGEAGKETVHIDKPGKNTGGGDIYVGPIYLDGQQIYGQLRYKMNENQGIFK